MSLPKARWVTTCTSFRTANLTSRLRQGTPKTKKPDLAKAKVVNTLEAGTVFGDLALMYNAPRNAGIVAASEGWLWKVDRYTFRRIANDLGRGKLSQYTNFLTGVKLLQPLTHKERVKIAEALEEVTFPKNHVVFKQGAEGDAMYIIKKGAATITKDGENIGDVKVGDYFGERALINNEPRAATITTTKSMQALKLDRTAFSLMLGPLEGIMKDRIDKYDEEPDAPEEDDVTTNSIAFDDLKILGTLGKGSFGHVQLVKDKSGKTYALKGVSKQQVVETNQQGHIMSEKNVMKTLHHPFLIRLYATYNKKQTLYFLLEPVLGGELFTVLRARRLFDEPTAKFFAAQVMLAFEYLHSKDTVYRDLKPENLLLDAEGYLKVTDFGFAKKIVDKTWTLCGTPDYLAPEIVQGKGHGKGVDWWTVGVLIFEMLASYTPFYHQNQLRMYDKIVRGKIKYPSHFSKNARSIISGLLEHKPNRRLGVINGGAALIKKHEWFEKFDFKRLVEKKYHAPIVPQIASPEDMTNFEQYDDDEDEEYGEYVDDGSGWDAEF